METKSSKKWLSNGVRRMACQMAEILARTTGNEPPYAKTKNQLPPRFQGSTSPLMQKASSLSGSPPSPSNKKPSAFHLITSPHMFLHFFISILTAFSLAIGLSTVLMPVFAAESSQSALSFPDVPEDYPYATAIRHGKNQEYLKGNPDGTFEPYEPITRAAFLKIMMEANKETTNGGGCFPDVENEWFAPYVCKAVQRNYIKGYPDGKFRPEQNIRFVEAAKILSTVFISQPQDTSAIWYKSSVDVMTTQRLIPPSIVQLDALVTRGELAEMVWRLKVPETSPPRKAAQFYNLESTPDVQISFGPYYYFLRGDMYFVGTGMAMNTVDQSTFVALGNEYAVDQYHFYYKGGIVTDDINDGQLQIYFWKLDKGYLATSEGVFYQGKLLQQSDGFSFRTISNGYGKDNQHVYYHQVLLENADTKTFEVLTPGDEQNSNIRARDKTSVYIFGEAVEGSHAPSYQSVEGEIWRDKNRYYITWKPITIEDGKSYDVETFQFLKDGAWKQEYSNASGLPIYARDKKNIFHYDGEGRYSRLEDFNPETFFSKQVLMKNKNDPYDPNSFVYGGVDGHFWYRNEKQKKETVDGPQLNDLQFVFDTNYSHFVPAWSKPVRLNYSAAGVCKMIKADLPLHQELDPTMQLEMHSDSNCTTISYIPIEAEYKEESIIILKDSSTVWTYSTEDGLLLLEQGVEAKNLHRKFDNLLADDNNLYYLNRHLVKIPEINPKAAELITISQRVFIRDEEKAWTWKQQLNGNENPLTAVTDPTLLRRILAAEPEEPEQKLIHSIFIEPNEFNVKNMFLLDLQYGGISFYDNSIMNGIRNALIIDLNTSEISITTGNLVAVSQPFESVDRWTLLTVDFGTTTSLSSTVVKTGTVFAVSDGYNTYAVKIESYNREAKQLELKVKQLR